jgi:ribosome-associated protein
MKLKKSKSVVPPLLALRVLCVRSQSSITDYLVLGTGTSEPHLRALRVELEKIIDQEDVRILGMDTGQESGWLVVDAFDIMVHVFTPENRRKYALESLWKDAEELPLTDVLAAPEKTRKAAPAKAAARRKVSAPRRKK